MPWNFVALILVVLKIIVYANCKIIHQHAMLSSTLEEDEKYDRLAQVMSHGSQLNDADTIPREEPKLAEANFKSLVSMISDDNRNARKFVESKKPSTSKRIFIPHKAFMRVKKQFEEMLRRSYQHRRTLGNGINEAKWFPNADCGPRLTAVDVPQPSKGFYYPGNILLHRCTGGCAYASKDSIHCAVKKASKILAIVYHTTYDNQGVRRSINALPWEQKRSTEVKTVEMTNHTECGCECVVKESHCNKKIQTYAVETCECLCKNLSDSFCGNSLQKWDTESCSCQCKNEAVHCGSNKKEWSADTCKCGCTQGIRNRCKRKNKLLNKDTCECYCPPAKCAPNEEQRRHDCSCVPITV